MLALTEQIQQVASQIEQVSKEYNRAIVVGETLDTRLRYARKLLYLQKQLNTLMELLDEKSKDVELP